MPTQITAYKAKDGTLFCTCQEAHDHDCVKDLSVLHMDSDGYWHSATYILRNRQKYLEILLRTC